MRSFLVVLAVGLVGLAAVALTQKSSLVYSLGASPSLRAAQLFDGSRACQGPIRPPSGAAFDRVGFVVTPVGDSRQPLRVEVRDADSRARPRVAGACAGGYTAFENGRPREQVVDVGRVKTDAPLELCLVGDGDGSTLVIGQAGVASPTTSATLNGKRLTSDLTFDLRTGDRSLAAWLPDIAERAAKFRAGWVTPGVYWVLAVLILIGAPAAPRPRPGRRGGRGSAQQRQHDAPVGAQRGAQQRRAARAAEVRRVDSSAVSAAGERRRPRPCAWPGSRAARGAAAAARAACPRSPRASAAASRRPPPPPQRQLGGQQRRRQGQQQRAG